MKFLLIVILFFTIIFAPSTVSGTDFQDENGYSPEWASSLDTIQTVMECVMIIENSMPDQNWCEQWFESATEEILEEIFENFLEQCKELEKISPTYSADYCAEYLDSMVQSIVDQFDEHSPFNKLKNYLPNANDLTTDFTLMDPENMEPMFSMDEQYRSRINASISQIIYHQQKDYPELTIRTTIGIHEYLTPDDSKYFFDNFSQSNATLNREPEFVQISQADCVQLMEEYGYSSTKFRFSAYCIIDNFFIQVRSSFWINSPQSLPPEFNPEKDKNQMLSIILEKISQNSETNLESGMDLEIPEWIRNNASWWASGLIGDSEFLSGIQYLINQRIMIIPETSQETTTQSDEIPSWIKQNAEWWSQGLISDSEFVKGIQYLVQKGIISL